MQPKKGLQEPCWKRRNFKASISSPPGNDNEIEQFDQLFSGYTKDVIERTPLERGKSDDDFFHLTCHVDPSLVSKIEKGEFIDLERLLPKDRNFGRNSVAGEQKIRMGEK